MLYCKSDFFTFQMSCISLCFIVEVRPRKRSNTDAEKKTFNQESHPLRPPCDCRQKCAPKLPQRRRIAIWLDFWSHDYNGRKQIIHQLVQSSSKKTTTSQTSSRQQSLIYHHIDDAGERVQVCKVFFLATIGYGPKSSVVDETKQTSAQTSS